jgi:hypothetical protein
VIATARHADAAQGLLDRVTGALKPLVIGDPARIQGRSLVEADAPADGAVTIACTR